MFAEGAFIFRLCTPQVLFFISHFGPDASLFGDYFSFLHCLGQLFYSRIPLAENGLFDCVLLGPLLVVSRVEFISFVLFLEALGVRKVLLYGSRKAGCKLCFVRASCATNPRPRGLVSLDITESRQSYDTFRGPKLRLRLCTQPRAAKATAVEAVVGKMALIPRAAAIV